MLKSETLLIPSAAGLLEVLYELPDTEPQSIAVVCHPHPLFEGTMHNKVAHMLARTLKQNNAVAVRFNFRGVGKSEGEHADGIGEVNDVLAVLNWAQTKWPDLPVSVAGFSFGSYVALLTVQNNETVKQFNIQKLITVAPPVGRWDFTEIQSPSFPWLVIQGSDDELVNANEVKAWCDSFAEPPTLTNVESADHFFHAKLSVLRSAIQAWIDSDFI